MNVKPFIAFDLEISNPFPDDHQERELCDFVDRLGISCAAIWSSESEKGVAFAGGGDNGAMYEPQMSSYQIDAFLDYLSSCVQEGRDVVSFNGLGFDFHVLHAEASPSGKLVARELARHHIDVAFQMFCEKGFMAGLEAICQAAGLGAKGEDMHGDQVPALWRESREAQDRCLRYVQRDAQMTGLAYLDIIEHRRVTWRKKNGRGEGLWLPRIDVSEAVACNRSERLLTVQESLAIPVPDTSWMDKPWTREKFMGWLSNER